MLRRRGIVNTLVELFLMRRSGGLVPAATTSAAIAAGIGRDRINLVACRRISRQFARAVRSGQNCRWNGAAIVAAAPPIARRTFRRLAQNEEGNHSRGEQGDNEKFQHPVTARLSGYCAGLRRYMEFFGIANRRSTIGTKNSSGSLS
jgi:hypothetical protein